MGALCICDLDSIASFAERLGIRRRVGDRVGRTLTLTRQRGIGCVALLFQCAIVRILLTLETSHHREGTSGSRAHANKTA